MGAIPVVENGTVSKESNLVAPSNFYLLWLETDVKVSANTTTTKILSSITVIIIQYCQLGVAMWPKCAWFARAPLKSVRCRQIYEVFMG